MVSTSNHVYVAGEHDLRMAEQGIATTIESSQRMDQAIGFTGLAPKILCNIRVARRTQVSRRRESLDLTHRMEVVSLSPAEQDESLERTEVEGWTAREPRRTSRPRRAGSWPRARRGWRGGIASSTPIHLGPTRTMAGRRTAAPGRRGRALGR